MESESPLQQLRALMRKHGVECYVIPSADEHQSEYVAPCDKRRGFISGFNGSAGTAVVTDSEAFVWTDSRYFLQAENQLMKGWKLMKKGKFGDPTMIDWISMNVKGFIGVDPKTFSISSYQSMQKKTSNKVKIIEENLVDKIWKDRPERPAQPIFALEKKVVGVGREEKIASLYEKMAECKSELMVLAALDEIAYTLNLRGSDILFNPVFYGYLTLLNIVSSGKKEAILFVNKTQIDTKVEKQLEEDGVKVMSKESLGKYLKGLKVNKPWLDASTCNVWLLQDKKDCIFESNPVPLMKAVKNKSEIEGIMKAHDLDGASMCRFFHWLDKQYDSKKDSEEKKKKWNEFELSEKVEEFRKQGSEGLFLYPSFETISSFKANAAIVHYAPSKKSAVTVDSTGIYLLDSGGQYLCGGTTDVTRTLHLGKPTELEKRCFTRVLQGHIALATAVFPTGTTGPKLDALARGALWKDGLDYRHGTGHGVGSLLNVHEGPHGIGSSTHRPEVHRTALVPGMLVTNEPGFYKSGSFGIRIENMLLVVNADPAFKKHLIPESKFLAFETICFIPIQKKLMDTTLMTKAEISWVNSYHEKVRKRLEPLLCKEPEVLQWMKDATSPLA